MKGMNHTGQRKQHGFMLMTAFVLSFAALLFALECSFTDGETSRTHSKILAGRQAETAPSVPVRQQSTLTPQPMRAILLEAVAAKPKSAYWSGGSTAYIAADGTYFFLTGKAAHAKARFQYLRTERPSFGSARAPPRYA